MSAQNAEIELTSDEREALVSGLRDGWICRVLDLPENQWPLSDEAEAELVVPAVEQIVIARMAQERERVAAQCQQWAVERFDEHGPHDARGAALWDLAAWLRETDPVAVEPDLNQRATVARLRALLDEWEAAHTHLGIERGHFGPSSSSLRAILDGPLNRPGEPT